MSPVSRTLHYEVIRTVFAMAEERGCVSLDEAAEKVGLTSEVVRELLEPVLYLEFKDDMGERIDETRAFLLDEAGCVGIDEGHWLRNLAAVPPNPLTALRLYAAARTLVDQSPDPRPELRTATAKLESLLQGSVVIPSERPACLDACAVARRQRTWLRFVYTTDAGVTGTRVIEPHHVYFNWSRWYVQGPEVGDSVFKSWRVERMQQAEPVPGSFEPNPDFDIPDHFDLAEHERSVRLRLPEATIDNLPTPNRIEGAVESGDGMVEATFTVIGEHRMRHLLVAAGPEAEVLNSAELESTRRDHPRHLLRAYTEGR